MAQVFEALNFSSKDAFALSTIVSRDLHTFAPIAEQTALNQPISAWTGIDRQIIDTFLDIGFVEKFIQLNSVEGKKGEDAFRISYYLLFKVSCGE